MSTTTVRVTGNRAKIEFRYDPDLVDLVREIPGRNFDKPTKSWSVPACPSDELARFITESGAQVIDPRGLLTPAPVVCEVEVGEMQPIEGAVTEGLYEHQRDLIAVVQGGARRILLADDPGLGKTAQAILSAAATGAQRVVVVAPASVKTSWAREVEKWWPGAAVQVLAGRKRKPVDPCTRVAIINYDILSARLNDLTSWSPDAVILDEIHYAKDSRSARGEATVELGQSVGADGLVMGLSGTPVPNRPIELAAPLDALGLLPRLGGFWSFARRYADAHKAEWGWDMSGASNLDELHEKLSELGMVRRRKTDVLDLPDRTVVDVPVDVSGDAARSIRAAQKTLVEVLVQAAFDLAERSDADVPDRAMVRQAVAAATQPGGAAFHEIGRLRQAIGLGKTPLVVSQVEDLVAAGQQVVVMAHHRSVQEEIADAFEGSVRITGGQDSEDRQRAIDRFQAGDAQVLVGSIEAAGVGVTLTAASNLVLAELPWNAASQDQAIDRIHRIGQDDPVTAWRTIATGTIDDQMAAIITEKAAIAGQVVDSTDEADADTRGQVDVLTDLVMGALKRR